MKKQLTAILSAAALLALTAPISAFADGNTAAVTVTVANAGKLEVTAEPLTVTDADGDGALTVNDTIILVHDKYYEGGAAAGFATAQTDWGTSITKFWGNENGGSYGYLVNDKFAYSLTDPVADGDAVYAYAYQDAAGYSDQYSYFDQITADGLFAGDAYTLTLTGLSFGADYSEQRSPLAGAVIKINGEPTEYSTDAEGKVTFQIPEGDFTVSAFYEPGDFEDGKAPIIVPPVFRATGAAKETTETQATETQATETQPVASTTTTSSALQTTTTTQAPATTTTAAATTTAASSTTAPPTGETHAVSALGLTAMLALGAAFVTRRRED